MQHVFSTHTLVGASCCDPQIHDAENDDVESLVFVLDIRKEKHTGRENRSGTMDNEVVRMKSQQDANVGIC